jgi:hypothetical protein
VVLLSAAATLLASLWATGVAAASPERIDFSYTNTFVDGDVCAADGLVVDVVERVSGFILEYTDDNGDFARAILQAKIEFDIAADNGVTLYERDRLVTVFTPDSIRQIGLWEHVQGPNGMVVLDAGQLVFDEDWNLIREPGRHSFFHGESSFCPGFLE